MKCETWSNPEPRWFNTGYRCVNKTRLNPNQQHCRNEKKEIIGQSGGTWYVADVVLEAERVRCYWCGSQWGLTHWLQDRKCQGLWVKWVLARVCRKPEAHPHLCASLARKHTHIQTFHIFCGHLGLIKGKWRAPCSSFKDKTKCCDVIPHQPSPRRREAL